MLVNEAMKYGRKILGLLLTVALATATLATDAGAAADQTASAYGQSAAGCHGYSDKSFPDSQNSRSPRPAPVSYQCCLTGHDAAAVRASLVPQPSGQITHLALRVAPAWYFLSGDLKVATVLSSDPPGSSPLRI
ncbi:MAG: hypothetical protein WBZ01_13055 [Terriglobales bacterium]